MVSVSQRKSIMRRLHAGRSISLHKGLFDPLSWFFPPLAGWIPTPRRTRGFVDQRRHHRHVSEALLCSAVRLSDMTPHCQRERSKGDPNGPCASTERSSRSCRFHIMKLFITRLKLSEGNEISSFQKRKKKGEWNYSHMSWRNVALQNKGYSSFRNCVVCLKSIIF